MRRAQAVGGSYIDRVRLNVRIRGGEAVGNGKRCGKEEPKRDLSRFGQENEVDLVFGGNNPTMNRPKQWFASEVKISTRWTVEIWGKGGEKRKQFEVQTSYAEKSTAARALGVIVFKRGKSKDVRELRRIFKAQRARVILVFVTSRRI